MAKARLAPPRVGGGSSLRRELWTLAHAHGNLLGILCLVFGLLGARLGDGPARSRTDRWLVVGAVALLDGMASFDSAGISGRDASAATA